MVSLLCASLNVFSSPIYQHMSYHTNGIPQRSFCEISFYEFYRWFCHEKKCCRFCKRKFAFGPGGKTKSYLAEITVIVYLTHCPHPIVAVQTLTLKFESSWNLMNKNRQMSVISLFQCDKQTNAKHVATCAKITKS